jgi:hypothetical protein
MRSASLIMQLQTTTTSAMLAERCTPQLPVTALGRPRLNTNSGVRDMIRFTDELRDRDLEGRVRQFLGARNFPALRRLAIEARNGTVTLRGRVATFYEKQLSQQCQQRVAGVRQLIDQVVVERPANNDSIGQTIGVNGKP